MQDATADRRGIVGRTELVMPLSESVQASERKSLTIVGLSHHKYKVLMEDK